MEAEAGRGVDGSVSVCPLSFNNSISPVSAIVNSPNNRCAFVFLNRSSTSVSPSSADRKGAGSSAGAGSPPAFWTTICPFVAVAGVYPSGKSTGNSVPPIISLNCCASASPLSLRCCSAFVSLPFDACVGLPTGLYFFATFCAVAVACLPKSISLSLCVVGLKTPNRS